MTGTRYPVPTVEGLYASAGQVWELHDDGTWSEIHGDGAEFGDHPFVRLVPVVQRDPMTADSIRDQVAREVGYPVQPDDVPEDRSDEYAEGYVAGFAAAFDAVLALPLIQAVAHEAWERGKAAMGKCWDSEDNAEPSEPSDLLVNPYSLTGPDPLDAVRAETLESAAADVYSDERAEGPHSHPLSVATWLNARAAVIRERGTR